MRKSTGRCAAGRTAFLDGRKSWATPCELPGTWEATGAEGVPVMLCALHMIDLQYPEKRRAKL